MISRFRAGQRRNALMVFALGYLCGVWGIFLIGVGGINPSRDDINGQGALGIVLICVAIFPCIFGLLKRFDE